MQNASASDVSESKITHKAQLALDNGHLGFRVVRVLKCSDGSLAFTIDFDAAVARQGVLGGYSELFGPGTGRTALGRRIRRSFGARLSEPRNPYQIELNISSQDMTEPPPPSVGNQVRGLPASVCLVLQVAVMSRGPLEHMAEYLRRLP